MNTIATVLAELAYPLRSTGVLITLGNFPPLYWLASAAALEAHG